MFEEDKYKSIWNNYSTEKHNYKSIWGGIDPVNIYDEYYSKSFEMRRPSINTESNEQISIILKEFLESLRVINITDINGGLILEHLKLDMPELLGLELSDKKLTEELKALAGNYIKLKKFLDTNQYNQLLNKFKEIKKIIDERSVASSFDDDFKYTINNLITNIYRSNKSSYLFHNLPYYSYI